MKIRKNTVTKLAALLAILAGVCWGIVGIFIRSLEAAGFDNPTMVFSRTSVAAVLMFLYILFTDRKKFRIGISGFFCMLAIGVFGSVLLMFAYNIAVLELSLSLAAILLCMAPVFVLLISAVLFREKISLKKTVCMIMAIAGCVLLSGVFEETGLQWSSKGLAMGLMSALCNAIFIIISKIVAKEGYSSITVCFYSALFSTILLIPFTDWNVFTSYLVASPAASSAFLLVQALISSVIPSIVYVIAMRHMEAGRTAILQSGAEPTAAMLTGIILFGELPTAVGIAGMIITVIALSVLAGDSDS